MVYAQHVREHFPRVIAGTTVADLDTLADWCRREHACDAFAAELLLPHAAVLASVAVLIQAHAGGPGPSNATLDQLAWRMAFAYDVSLTAARISIAECFGVSW
jgi:hypothetical protein